MQAAETRNGKYYNNIGEKPMTHKITQTNGNAINGIRGSRLSIWGKDDELVDQFVIPTHNAQGYCKRHPTGNYAKRLQGAVKAAKSKQ